MDLSKIRDYSNFLLEGLLRFLIDDVTSDARNQSKAGTRIFRVLRALRPRSAKPLHEPEKVQNTVFAKKEVLPPAMVSPLRLREGVEATD